MTDVQCLLWFALSALGIYYDCGTLGIVLFKLEWDGRYRTVLAVKCNRQNRIP